MQKWLKRLGWLLGLAMVIMGVFAGMNRLHILMSGNIRYYQRTKPYNPNEGGVNQKLFSKPQLQTLTLQTLTRLTHGNKYTGNASLARVATDYTYRQSGQNIQNFMGSDGVLQLYNESKLMRTPMVKDAATFWNKVAGETIVQVVDKARASDEVIHDSQTKQKYLGGQHYDGTGIQFFPKNWQSQGFSTQDNQVNREAVLIREIGHALGIPDLGGGPAGENAGREGYITTEVMGVWETGPNRLPANRRGIRSTPMDAAALAIAGTSWQRPQRVATSVLSGHQLTVVYHSGRVAVIK
ncbi:MAG TPA: hypothetical protein K8U88_01105 [Levilactobacillus hammesii]|uniref:Uncharacterized protein n=1 Tax=Levilactobacillus hammesii TaxID=267633 RepID=A0A921F021_9LACO|nr:hypothetical protein [Levilactobacillus hammesii]